MKRLDRWAGFAELRTQVLLHFPANVFVLWDLNVLLGLERWNKTVGEHMGDVFEAVGDAQLAVFRRDPSNAGKVLTNGLWRYTRHPNYFGDSLIWWGIFTIAASVPGSIWSAFAPLLMTWLLVRVSGVALLESSLRETRPGYADYVERTSAFVPWPPRRGGPGEG